MHTVRRELASANVAARCSKRNFSTVPRRQVRTVRTRRSKRDAVTAQLAARADGNRYTAQRLLRRKCSGRRGWESVRRTTREPHDAQSRRQVPIPTRFPRIATDSSGTPYILRGLLLPSLVGRRAKCSRKWLALVLERLLYAGMRDVTVVAEFTKRIPVALQLAIRTNRSSTISWPFPCWCLLSSVTLVMRTRFQLPAIR